MMRSVAAFPRLFRFLMALAVALAMAGCGMLPEQKDETAGWSAAKLYSEAKDAQADGAWDKAAKLLEKLEARFPYGRYSQQAQLELGYIYWKTQEPILALAACDRFIKLHPNHPAVDYVYYLKGLIGFNEDLGLLGHLSQQDPSERDPKSAREAFDAFKELVSRFPDSKYTPDAIARMNYLVNALALQEVHVARYYLKRGAYIAAINRAQQAIKSYPGSPANEEALFIMAASYGKLGMNDLRNDTERVMKKNFPSSRFYKNDSDERKAWWKLW